MAYRRAIPILLIALALSSVPTVLGHTTLGDLTGTLTDFLGTMLANETKTAFFTIDIDSNAQPGQYTYNLRFDWTQDTNALYDD